MDALKPIETRQGWSKQKVDEYNRYRIQSVLEAEFDLLVIDECHKVGGSNTQVGRFQMADILCNAIPNVLLQITFTVHLKHQIHNLFSNVHPMFTPKRKNPHKSLIYKGFHSVFVDPLGLEPRTP